MSHKKKEKEKKKKKHEMKERKMGRNIKGSLYKMLFVRQVIVHIELCTTLIGNMNSQSEFRRWV